MAISFELQFPLEPADAQWSAIRRLLRHLITANPSVCNRKPGVGLHSKFLSGKGEYWRAVDAEVPVFGRYRFLSSDPEAVKIAFQVLNVSPGFTFLLQKSNNLQSGSLEDEALAKVVLAWLTLISNNFAIDASVKNVPASVKIAALELAKSVTPDLVPPDWMGAGSDAGSGSGAPVAIERPASLDFRS